MITSYQGMLRSLGLTEREIEILDRPSNRIVAIPFLIKLKQQLRTESHVLSILQLLATL